MALSNKRQHARQQSAGTTNPRAQRTRFKLISAVTELAQEQLEGGGIATLTPAAISRRAGVSPSSFYTHFDGISDLETQALRHNLGDVERDYLALAKGSDEPITRQQLAQVFRELLSEFDRFSGLIVAAFGAGGNAGRMIAEYQKSIEISLLLRTPQIPEGGLHTVSAFLSGGILALYSANPSETDRERVIDTLVTVVPVELTGSAQREPSS